MGLASFMAIAHQPSLLQNAEMLSHGPLRDPGLNRQGTHCLLSFTAKPLKQGPSGGIGERSEEHILSVRHLQYITNWLLVDI